MSMRVLISVTGPYAPAPISGPDACYVAKPLVRPDSANSVVS